MFLASDHMTCWNMLSLKPARLILLASPTQAEQAAVPRVLTVFLGSLGVRHPAKVRLSVPGCWKHTTCYESTQLYMSAREYKGRWQQCSVPRPLGLHAVSQLGLL